MRKKVLSILLINLLLCGAGSAFSQTIVIISDSTWKGVSTFPGLTWLNPGFNDSAWPRVEAPNAANTIPVVPGSVSMWALPNRDTAYMRKTFRIPVGSSYSGTLQINADDEFWLFFNGTFYAHENNWFAGPFNYTLTPALAGCTENVIAVITRNNIRGTAYGVSLKATITVVNPLTTPVTYAPVTTSTYCNGFLARWDSVPGATQYFLDVSTDSNFATFLPGYNGLSVGLANSSLVSGLSLGVRYFYRVRAIRTPLTSCNSTVIGVTTAQWPITNISRSICSNDSIFLQRAWRRTAGIYFDTLRTIFSCDSVLRTTLTINPTYLTPRNRFICDNDSAFLGGQWRKTTGTYFDSLRSVLGCDSVIQTNLTAGRTTFNRTLTICDGDASFLAGSWQTTPGVYIDHFTQINGCDSVLQTTLVVNPNNSHTRSVGICIDQTFFAGGALRNTAGTYYDTLRNYLNCDSVLRTDLLIIPASFNSRNVTICPGQTFRAGGANQTAAGTYYDTLVNAGGCDSILTTNLSLHPLPSVSAGNDTSICSGLSAVLNASGAGTFRWSNGSSGSSTIVTPSGPTTYTVTITDANSCTASDAMVVSLYPLPAIFINDTTICLGRSAYLQANAGTSYNWSTGAGSAGIRVSPTSTSDYSVTATDANGCSSSASVRVNVSTISADIDASPGTVIHQGQSVTLIANIGVNDSVTAWYPSITLSASSGPRTEARPTGTTLYFVNTLNTDGCVGRDSILITVIPPDVVVVPTGFTPNRDGLNDFLKFKTPPDLMVTRFTIFNRWGELVFSYPDQNDDSGWDGTYKEREQPMGTYIWYAEAVNKLTRDRVTAQGTVTLIR